MKLFAVSDLHLGHAANREALAGIRARPDDWLILAGDVAEKDEHIRLAFEHLGDKFARLVWVPGNHELWTRPGAAMPRGEARYRQLIALCRAHGVLTPEDPYPVLALDSGSARLAPLFTLYDYSFRPPDVALADAVAWARESGVVCSDEFLLSPAPHASRVDWCHARLAETEARLEAARDALPTILVNHWPLRAEFAQPPRVPRFSLWCGSVRTADWHRRFDARAVVYGHVHMPSSRRVGETRFEEVSFGYPKQWQGRRDDPDSALREIRLD